jgi:MFS family permease
MDILPESSTGRNDLLEDPRVSLTKANNDDSDNDEQQQKEQEEMEKRLRLKVDLRLCTIAGILCSLNLLDSGIISSASVTSMLQDLGLEGNRYSVSIFIFTVSSVVFQLPSTLAVRMLGPRIWFAIITFCFGLFTLCTAFVQTWRQMIALRVLLGISMSGIYPGLTYLISTWYTRKEQQLRFAFLQSGEVLVLATGNIVNYGLNHLNGRAGLAGWRWMFIVQGLITCVIGIVTYWWMVDFPENAQNSFRFLSESEIKIATQRIQADRDDVMIEPFSWSKILVHFLDPKLYGFSCLFFLLNLVSTSLSYFLPIILQSGMGFSENASIILSAPVSMESAVFLNRSVSDISATAILLGRDPRSFYLIARRSIPPPRADGHLQRSGPHRRVSDVRSARIQASRRPVHRHVSSHGSVCLELGGPERVSGEQHCRTVETGDHCRCDNCMQWSGWYCGQFHRQSARSA